MGNTTTHVAHVERAGDQPMRQWFGQITLMPLGLEHIPRCAALLAARRKGRYGGRSTAYFRDVLGEHLRANDCVGCVMLDDRCLPVAFAIGHRRECDDGVQVDVCELCVSGYRRGVGAQLIEFMRRRADAQHVGFDPALPSGQIKEMVTAL